MKDPHLYLAVVLTLWLTFNPIESRIHRNHLRPRNLIEEDNPMETNAEDESIFDMRPHLEGHSDEENELLHNPISTPNQVPMNFINPAIENQMAKYKHE